MPVAVIGRDPECDNPAPRGTGLLRRLAAQAEAGNDLCVARVVLLLEIVEQATALADHDQQAATGMEILLVALQVFRQILDPLGEDRDLDLG